MKPELNREELYYLYVMMLQDINIEQVFVVLYHNKWMISIAGGVPIEILKKADRAISFKEFIEEIIINDRL